MHNGFLCDAQCHKQHPVCIAISKRSPYLEARMFRFDVPFKGVYIIDPVYIYIYIYIDIHMCI